MRAVRGAPPGVEVVDVDEPEGEGELIRVASASVCASDFVYLGWGSRAVLGHEIAGVSEAGVAVAVEGIFGCGMCAWCEAGRYNRCQRATVDILGVTVPGGMSTWFRAPSRALVPLPAGLDPKDASLVEPASVAWHAVQMGRVGTDTRTVVVGAGAIGILAGIIAQSVGAPEVAMAARHPHRARGRGALRAVGPRRFVRRGDRDRRERKLPSSLGRAGSSGRHHGGGRGPRRIGGVAASGGVRQRADHDASPRICDLVGSSRRTRSLGQRLHCWRPAPMSSTHSSPTASGSRTRLRRFARPRTSRQAPSGW